MSNYVLIHTQAVELPNFASCGWYTSGIISDEETRKLKRYLNEDGDLEGPWLDSYNQWVKYHVKIITDENEVATLRKIHGDLFVIGVNLKELLVDYVEDLIRDEEEEEDRRR